MCLRAFAIYARRGTGLQFEFGRDTFGALWLKLEGQAPVSHADPVAATRAGMMYGLVRSQLAHTDGLGDFRERCQQMLPLRFDTRSLTAAEIGRLSRGESRGGALTIVKAAFSHVRERLTREHLRASESSLAIGYVDGPQSDPKVVEADLRRYAKGLEGQLAQAIGHPPRENFHPDRAFKDRTEALVKTYFDLFRTSGADEKSALLHKCLDAHQRAFPGPLTTSGSPVATDALCGLLIGHGFLQYKATVMEAYRTAAERPDKVDLTAYVRTGLLAAVLGSAPWNNAEPFGAVLSVSSFMRNATPAAKAAGCAIDAAALADREVRSLFDDSADGPSRWLDPELLDMARQAALPRWQAMTRAKNPQSLDS